MATKKSAGKKTSTARTEQVKFLVQPGTKVHITVDVGDEIINGKVPLKVYIEQIGEEQIQEQTQTAEISHPEPMLVALPAVPAVKPKIRLEALKSRLQTYDLAMWLFIFAVAIYLVTRLIGLTQFPIYFFTDEAIQSQSMIDLINNKYRDSTGAWFPTYFRNGEYYNIGLSVYLQWLPALLFGKSAVATRVTSVLVTLIAAISIGIILRDVFKMKYWWMGTLFLSITPAWFLHSRTAFETAEFVAFYAGTLCAYLFYRHKSARYLYLTIFLGALAFYTYSPAQFIMPLTAIALMISDWRYHWENRRTVLIGLALGVVLALPYIRHSLNNPSAPFAHLHTLFSYWFEKIPISEKITRYLTELGIGLSPWYWYIPNDRDLSRHLMKDYGNIMIATLPFALLGLAHVLRNIRWSAYRTVLIALLISPTASALVQTSITRALAFVVPVAILTAIGLEQILQWVEDPKKRLAELALQPGVNSRRVVAALLILIIGIPVAFTSKEDINRFTLSALVVLVALQVAGVVEWLAQSLTRSPGWADRKSWTVSQTVLALSAFIALSGTNVYMLNDALRNGPLWFRDYGMGGMQYGAFQIFDIVEQYIKDHPEAQIIFSPDWANGTDVVARYMLDDPSRIQIGSVRGHITQKLPLDDNVFFIMTPQEYDMVMENAKLTDVDIDTIIPYPDGNPGFYFVHLRYVDNIDEIFAAEKAARQASQESSVTIDGEEVKLRYPYLDSDFQAESIALVFDNDPYTVAKTYENNPFVIEMTFPAPRTVKGFSIIIGSAKVQIKLKCYPTPGAEPTTYTFDGQGTKQQPELSFDLPTATQAQVLQVEVLDLLAPDLAKIHIWELTLH
jgi:4-amino-4-deoxy-L-arabinose transferase-like glycosyltransferase